MRFGEDFKWVFSENKIEGRKKRRNFLWGWCLLSLSSRDAHRSGDLQFPVSLSRVGLGCSGDSDQHSDLVNHWGVGEEGFLK